MLEVVLTHEGHDCAVAPVNTMAEACAEAFTMHAHGHYPILRQHGRVIGRWNGTTWSLVH